MNKRKFLKAAGVSAFVSLLASPILGRREAGSANAQEGGDLAQEIAKLRQELRNEAENGKRKIKKSGGFSLKNLPLSLVQL